MTKQPTPDDATRCFRLRCQSKNGIRLHPDDSKFCEEMFRKYPNWYRETEVQVFDATNPWKKP